MKTLFKPIAIVFALAITTSYANAGVRIHGGFPGIKLVVTERAAVPQHSKMLRKREAAPSVGRVRVGVGVGVRQPSGSWGTRYTRRPVRGLIF